MNNTLLFFHFFAIILFSTPITAREAPGTLQGENMALKYLVKAPAKISKKTPVIILLHGVGSNEKDLFSLAPQLPGDALIISARAPITLSENAYAWYHLDFKTGAPTINNGEAEKARQLLLRFIDEIIKKYHTDPSQVFLMGFSQGAIMSYSVGLTEPGKVKGVVIMSGRILDETKTKVAGKDKLTKLALFAGHGSLDKTLAVSYARDAQAYLKSIGVKSDYHEYKMGHEISAPEVKDIQEWLGRQMH